MLQSMMIVHRGAFFLTLVIGGTLALVGCHGSSTTQPTQNTAIDQFLSSASAAGVSSVRQQGSPPPPAGGPAVTPSSISTGPAGGTNLVLLQGSDAFQKVFVSLGSAETARNEKPGVPVLLTATLRHWFEAPLVAATVQPTGFLQLDLPSPVTELPLVVKYAESAAGNIDLRFQLAGASGAAGPVATLSKNVNGSAISLIGVVYNRWIGTPGPSSPQPDPVAGATVSTSLSAQTAVTSGSGYFELQTGVRSSSCYTLTITAPGLPTFSVSRKLGSSDVVAYTLASTPQYPVLPPCS